LKKKLILGIVVVITIIIAFMSYALFVSPEKKEDTKIFHVRLADPKMYKNGIFSDTFTINNGTYKFRFVPNGDSPQVLTVTLKGDSFSFSEDFKLEGTLQESGNYTWKYLGQDKIQISNEQNIQIAINPHGNILGPVSIYLEK
jgi:hypothetical protein